MFLNQRLLDEEPSKSSNRLLSFSVAGHGGKASVALAAAELGLHAAMLIVFTNLAM